MFQEKKHFIEGSEKYLACDTRRSQQTAMLLTPRAKYFANH